MIFGKKNHLVGLDIGSSFIKVAEMKVSSKEYTLQKFGVRQVTPGHIVEGRIVNIEALAKEIKDLFKSQKIREKNVAISTGGHSVVVKTISIANKPEKEMHDTVIAEAEQYIPYDIDDVNIDYQVLGPSEFSPDQVNVLLVAVKKDLVAEYIEVVQTAGLNPRIIDVDTFALQNTFEILPYENHEKTTLLVDLGASKTSLNILKANVSMMMRDNVFGTNQIVEEICNQYDIPVSEAYQAANGESTRIGADKITAIGTKVAQGWSAEIADVVNAYEAGTGDEKVENVILSGGGVFVQGFEDSLLNELDADVSVINPFQALAVNENKFAETFITQVSPMAPIAIGLALRRIDDK